MAVFTKNTRKHIFVHPGDQHKLHNAIRVALLKDRKKYSDSLEGALLDVSNIKVIGDRHLIVNGYLSMEVVADFKVFAPTVGMTLEGVINKVNRAHYGCLVMNLFNASLSLTEDYNHIPKEGDACSFIVTKLVVDGDLLFMRGNINSVTPTERMNSVDSQDISTSAAAVPDDSKSDINIKKEDNFEDDISHLSKSTKKHKKHRCENKSGILAGNFSEQHINELHPPEDLVQIKQESGTERLSMTNGEITKSPKTHKKKHKHDKESIEMAGNDSQQHINHDDSWPVTIKTEKVSTDDEQSPNKKKKKRKSDQELSSATPTGGMNGAGDLALASIKLKPGVQQSLPDTRNSEKSAKKRKLKYDSDTGEIEKSAKKRKLKCDSEKESNSVCQSDFIQKVIKLEPVSPQKGKSKKLYKHS